MTTPDLALPPEVYAWQQRWESADERAKELERCRRSAWWWYKRWVYTFDQQDQLCPYKRAPHWRYVRGIIEEHWETGGNHLYVKFRAAFLSTLFSALIVHGLQHLDAPDIPRFGGHVVKGRPPRPCFCLGS